MRHPSRSQRGEGKLGCILSLLVLGTLVAVLMKAGPVYYSNWELTDACDFIATEASRLPAEQVEANVRSKAKELEIAEAMKQGAITVTKTAGDQGTCTIRLKYTRKIDLYGLFTWPVETDKRITKTIFTNI